MVALKRIKVSRFKCAHLGILVFCILSAESAFSKVVLPKLFTDNMILQQKEKVAIWGNSAINKNVVITTSWNNKKYSTTSDAKGEWKIAISTPRWGGPYTISFNDGEETTLSNVLIGEVWICSGQSNAEMPLAGWGKINNYKEEIEKANHPNIRLIQVEKSTSTQLLNMAAINNGWQPCTPSTIPEFSAIAYFFARNIQQHHNIPIGLIQTAYSGTPVEAWTSGAALKTVPEYDSLVDVISSKQGTPDNPHIPTVLFNAMVNPLVPYGIRGVIWYQGEANASRAHQYKTLFPLLINDWRKQWGKDFPFFFVQLANFKELQKAPEDSDWAELREAQLQTLSLPKTGMAVAIDLGDVLDIHPKNKQGVGARLALIARAKVHKEKIPYSGPIFKSYKVRDNQVIISFNHIHGGLQAKGSEQLKGFTIAGADQKFHWATATIKGNKIIVCSDAVKDPVAVRYAWAINPINNLYNKAGLPASPFRTDSWKGITEPK